MADGFRGYVKNRVKDAWGNNATQGSEAYQGTPTPFLLTLLSDVQLLDDCTIAVDINLLQITEEVTSVTNHLQKTAAAVVVLHVGLQVLGQAVDAVGQNSDLNLRGTCVTLVDGILGNDCLLFGVCHGFFTFQIYLAWTQKWVGEMPLCGCIPRPCSCHALHYNIHPRFCKGGKGNFTLC